MALSPYGRRSYVCNDFGTLIFSLRVITLFVMEKAFFMPQINVLKLYEVHLHQKLTIFILGLKSIDGTRSCVSITPCVVRWEWSLI